MSVGKRLIELRNCLESKKIIKDKKEFCDKLNINYFNFSKYANDKINFSIDSKNMSNLYELKVNINWLLTGQGSMFLDEKKTSSQEGKEPSKADTEELKKKEAEIEKLKTELEELKKIVAGLEKDNKELSSELLEKYRELTGFLKPKSDRFEFT